MKYFLLIAFGIMPFITLAQNNYIVSIPNSTTPGSDNVLIGPKSGTALTTGTYNVFLGSEAGSNEKSGSANVFLGAQAGRDNVTGNFNVFTGFKAGQKITSGYNNTFIGANSGELITDGYENTFIGKGAGGLSIAGNQNIFIGPSAGYNNKGGNRNILLGLSAGRQINIGSNNTYLGIAAGYSTNNGNNNTFVGANAGYNNTDGSNNIIIGPNSGTAITTGDDNVLMGYNSQAEDGLYNATAIGSNSRVAISNALILGNQANVGIGTSAPTTRLEVVSDALDASGLRLSRLTASSPSTQSTDQFLSVDQKGNVVKARYQLRINSPSEWSDKVFAPGYQLRPLAEVKKYIQTNQHLPGIPSAEQVVNEGVDLVRMNATLLEKVEELTLYLIDQQKTIKEMKAEIDELKASAKK